MAAPIFTATCVSLLFFAISVPQANLLPSYARHLAVVNARHRRTPARNTADGQNKKYLCASGNTCAGSQVINSPSTRTSYVSGSTSIFGVALLWIMSFFPIRRQFRTAAIIFVSPILGGKPAERAA